MKKEKTVQKTNDGIVFENISIAWNHQFIGFHPGEQLKRHIKNELEKLSRILKRFPPGGVHLEVVMSMASGREEYFEVKLTLKISSNVLHVKKEDSGPISAFSQACAALEREITKTASLKRNHRHQSLKSIVED